MSLRNLCLGLSLGTLLLTGGCRHTTQRQACSPPAIVQASPVPVAAPCPGSCPTGPGGAPGLPPPPPPAFGR